MKSFKYIDLVTAAFAVVLVISNIVSNKLTVIGPFTFDAGTILFPLIYIFGDILTEVYGYARARRVIWTGFGLLILSTLVIYLAGVLPPAPDWGGQESYQTILGLTPRIVLGSLVAYFFGEFANSFVLAKLKVKMQGKMLWVRTIGSTLIGEGLDTVIFVMIAFYGVFPNEVLLAIVVSNYIFKVLVEVLFTPVTYAIVGHLKKVECEDHYDKDTDFNPFKLR